MQSLAEVSLTELEAVLTPSEVRTFQVIQGVLGVGIVLLTVVVLLPNAQRIKAVFREKIQQTIA